MKSQLLKTFLTLGLIIALSLNAFTQSTSSITVPTDKTIAFLIAENKKANELIDKQNARIADLEAQLETELKNGESLSRSYESAKAEISFLKQSNEALTRAVALNEQTIKLLQDDNLKQREKVKEANKAKWKAYLIAGGVILIKILF